MSEYSESALDLIFSKAQYVSLGVRIDCDGRIIWRSEYGKYTAHGWHVDHDIPSILGGGDGFANLRPRHWLGNTRAGGLLGGIGGLRDVGR
ncbi:MAG: hypothetical protein ACT4N4_14330 [Rhodospirillales bacterium]